MCSCTPALLQTGTDGQWWLDWDKEYRGWKQANLTVDVSYQFTAHDQPPASWPDAYSTAYTLGYKFTRHFGRQFGTNNVASFEAGNEPCEQSFHGQQGHDRSEQHTTNDDCDGRMRHGAACCPNACVVQRTRYILLVCRVLSRVY